MRQVYSLFEQRVQIFSKVPPKLSKITSPSMNFCTETPALASSRKGSVFFSYDWLPILKNEDVFNFIGAYIGIMEKSSQSTDVCPIKSFFLTGGQSYEKKILLSSLQV